MALRDTEGNSMSSSSGGSLRGGARSGAGSALTNGPVYTDPKMTQHLESSINGSRELCAAILRTGNTHRKMDAWEQLDARRYAFGPGLIDKRTWK